MKNTTCGINRRSLLHVGLGSLVIPGTNLLNLGCQSDQNDDSTRTDTLSDNRPDVTENNKDADEKMTMKIQYLEIVTTDVQGSCLLYSQMHGVTFGDADPNLGGARTAKLADGGLLGIRGQLRDTEQPVVRPYMLTDDISAAVSAAAEAGAEIAMPPTEIPGQGQFAIVILGGIESGLWQL